MGSIFLALIAGLTISSSPLAVPVQGQKVTFECLGLPADRAMESLSRATGLAISAAPTTAAEVLVISVKDVPVETLLDKIAQAASAGWQRDGEKWMLIRSPALAQKQQKEHVARMSTIVRQSQERLNKKIAEQPNYDPNSAKKLAIELESFLKASTTQEGQDNYRAQSLFMDRLPAKLLADRLAVLLDPSALATLEDGQRVVFSLQPTRMQRPLNKAAAEELQIFAHNCDLLREAYPGTFDENKQYRFDTSLLEAIKERNPEDRVPTQLLVKVSAQEMDRFSIEVLIGNAKNHIIGRSNASFNASNGTPSFMEKPAPAVAGELPIEVGANASELIKALQTAFSRGGAPDTIPDLSPELRNILLNPEKHDVAELGGAAMLAGTAKAKNVNLVAHVPDLLGFILPMAFATGSTTPSQVLKVLKNEFMPQTAEVSDGWLVVRPEDPYSTRKQHVDRKLLGRLLRSAVSKGYVAIDELAEFAAQGPRVTYNSIAMPYLMLLMPNAIRTLDYNHDPHYLRLHGSLSAMQKQALASGQKIPISALSPAQKTLVDEIVFGDRNPRISFKSAQIEGEDYDYWNRIDTEPTVRFGNGLPPNTLLGMTNTSGTNIHAEGTYQGQHQSNTDFDLRSLASYLAEKDRVGGQNWYPDHEWTSFQAEDKTEYRYQIALNPNTSYEGQLVQKVPKGPKVPSLEKLPQDVWKRIQEEIEKVKAQRNGNKIPPRR